MKNQIVWTSASILVFQLCLLLAPSEGKNVICYYTNWPQYRPGNGKFTPMNIDPYLCTHIFYAFAQLDRNTVVNYEWNDEDGWSQVNSMKNVNPKLKTLLAVGGYTHGTARFQAMASTAANRAEFINSAITLLRRTGFDGLDIDWEYPETSSDRSNFNLLVQETMAAFTQEGISTNRPRLLLAAAMPAGISKIKAGYDVRTLANNMDLMSIMTYDYHGAWELFTGLASALFSDTDPLNVNTTIQYYLDQGVRPDQINLGLSLYARTWTLTNSGDTAVGSSASGPGSKGTYTGESGVLSYYEVCGLLNQGYTSVTDIKGQVKIAYSGNQWITYEDRETLSVKLNYVEGEGFAGVMIWSFDHDDFNNNFCGQGKYPLIGLISSRVLNMGSPRIETTTTTSTTTTKSSITNAPPTTTTTTTTTTTKATTKSTATQAPTAFVCPLPNGIFPDTTTCTHYFLCVNTISMRANCPTGTVFNYNAKKCENELTSSFKCGLTFNY